MLCNEVIHHYRLWIGVDRNVSSYDNTSCVFFYFRQKGFLPPQHDSKRTSNLRTRCQLHRRQEPVSKISNLTFIAAFDIAF